jgi:metallo-beta-lactamase family protein
MKIQFLGATGTVTGSRYLVSHGDSKVLVDAGLFQGFKNLRLKNWEKLPQQASGIDAVLLTHAHLDHSGYIPLLVKNKFKGSIYSTAATFDLCKILLPDSGYLQEEEAKFANKHGFSKHKPALPLYTYEDAKNSLDFFQPTPWKTATQMQPQKNAALSFEFHPAGHLLGAASLLIKSKGKSIAFSGDLGRTNDPLIRNPDFNQGADYLVVESTYGNKKHPMDNPEELLEKVISKTLERKGIVLIPSFAVGRAQLILYYILQLKRKKLIPFDLPVYLNSPMAAEANKAYLNNPNDLKLSPSEVKEIWAHVRIIASAAESVALNEKTESAIIIAASGMATGGRVLHHLKNIAPNPNNTILFVGFQAGGTRGDQIVRGAQEVKIHGELWPIKAEVVNIESLSAHADADEILTWISNLKHRPQKVFVTHGEPAAADTLRHRIEQELKIPAMVPELYQEIEL